MSFEFVIGRIGPQKLQDGKYRGTIRHFEDKDDTKFGRNIIVETEIEAPEANAGYIHIERFQIGAANEIQREIAEQRLSSFFNSMLNLQEGETVQETQCLSLVNKKCEITLKTNKKGYQNVISRVPYSDYQFPVETGIKAPESLYGKVNIPTNVDLNDDVPF